MVRHIINQTPRRTTTRFTRCAFPIKHPSKSVIKSGVVTCYSICRQDVGPVINYDLPGGAVVKAGLINVTVAHHLPSIFAIDGGSVVYCAFGMEVSRV